MDLKVYMSTFSRILMWYCSAYRQWISFKHSMSFIFYMLYWYEEIYLRWVHFLGTFTNLQKGAVSFITSVCLPTWNNFSWVQSFAIFWMLYAFYPPQPVSVLRPAPTQSPSFLLAQVIFKPNLFPYKYSNILKPSHSSYLSVYEDRTDRVFQNISI
jgi:hypothetical protein